MLSIQRYVFDLLDSNMYLITENKNAILIDPHYCMEVNQGLKRQAIENIDIILTHEHFDHVSGAMYYAQFAHNIYAGKKCAEVLKNPRNRMNSRFAATFVNASEELRSRVREACKDKVIVNVTCPVSNEYHFIWNNHNVVITYTPGHTPGSVCIMIDKKILFTGDSLIPDNDVITRFPGGNLEQYRTITQAYFHSLDKELLVYPGHGEEKKLGDLL